MPRRIVWTSLLVALIRVKTRIVPALAIGVALFLPKPLEADGYRWYRFSKAFIAQDFQNGEAFGSVVAKKWDAAKNVHPTKCGGDDGELHIGVFNSGLADATSMPSLPAGDDDQWGLVAELPDAGSGDGPTTLDSVIGQPVTFKGYFRVWNEGHDQGAVHPSNPHHVLEVHPAWAFETHDGGTSFESPELIRAMSGYQGYGATKFNPIFKTIQAEEWPSAYQDDTYLYVSLLKAENFYQLPVTVTDVKAITGGHEATVDVYPDTAFKTKRFEGLRCVSVVGSPYDQKWKKGEKTYLLGFFSVNLSRALAGAGQAFTEENAVPVPEALEFFVFGRPLGKALASCAK